jgi:hypothetical protein
MLVRLLSDTAIVDVVLTLFCIVFLACIDITYVLVSLQLSRSD